MKNEQRPADKGPSPLSGLHQPIQKNHPIQETADAQTERGFFAPLPLYGAASDWSVTHDVYSKGASTAQKLAAIKKLAVIHIRHA
ncbi:hypothetical protein [Pseudomonas sp. WS 5413]|uniref:hypothetical protein n=1 Tax=Pseudomonas sp. WS 5413 TaxID=2717488 RepID=UPI001474876B|nr:hypothetical protein [Pseudomonas sp. WS 5413]NMX34757.1 hypothetical protein [Pseudomonas sp. WS 5413]